MAISFRELIDVNDRSQRSGAQSQHSTRNPSPVPPEVSSARREPAPGQREPYVSAACRMGTHNDCKEGEPREPTRNSVSYETCSCTWCHSRQKTPAIHPNCKSVVATASSVLTGDVIVIGGTAFTVANTTVLMEGARRLQFTTGEGFTMRSRTRLRVFRPKGEG